MRKGKSISVVICLLTVLFLLDSSYALLTDNLDGTVTQIRNDGSVLMWLKDANLAATSGYCLTVGNCLDSNGMVTWTQVNNWINTLNSTNYLGYNNWRLPATLPVNGTSHNWDWSFDGSTDRGWNITSPNSEMAYLFYVELGNLGEYDTNGNYQTGFAVSNSSGPFVNIVNLNRPDLAYNDGWYWSGTDVVGLDDYDKVGFNFGLGRQYGGYIPGYGDHGWAVRDFALSDLVILSIKTTPVSPLPGKNVTVTDTTKNQGTGTAGPSTTKFYFSTDTTYSAGDIYLGYRDVPSLASGETSQGITSVTIPLSVCCAADTYYILAVADAENDVPESNEANNVKSSPVRIGTDLIVSALSAPSSAVRGSTIAVADTTKNQGKDTAGASKTKFYLSTDSTLNPWDTLLSGRSVPSLLPGKSSKGSTNVTIPLNTPDEAYYIIAVADAKADVCESNEANNNKYTPITILP